MFPNEANVSKIKDRAGILGFESYCLLVSITSTILQDYKIYLKLAEYLKQGFNIPTIALVIIWTKRDLLLILLLMH
jgi:hypothetical protein